MIYSVKMAAFNSLHLPRWPPLKVRLITLHSSSRSHGEEKRPDLFMEISLISRRSGTGAGDGLIISSWRINSTTERHKRVLWTTLAVICVKPFMGSRYWNKTPGRTGSGGISEVDEAPSGFESGRYGVKTAWWKTHQWGRVLENEVISSVFCIWCFPRKVPRKYSQRVGQPWPGSYSKTPMILLLPVFGFHFLVLVPPRVSSPVLFCLFIPVCLFFFFFLWSRCLQDCFHAVF